MAGEIGSDDVHIRITCPHCRRQFQKAAAWIDANDYVRCDFCREPLGLSIYKRQAAAATAAKVSVAATPAKPPPPVKAAAPKKATAKKALAKKAPAKARKPKR
jgi:hypothetical protein